MPDTYFTRKEAIAHGEAIDPITREEALIQKAATPLSVKDAALYALKSGGSTPSDYRIIDLTVKGAASLSILEDYVVSVKITGEDSSEAIYYASELDFDASDAGKMLLYAKILLPNNVRGFEINLSEGSIYSPTLSYTGLTRMETDGFYEFTSNTVIITIGAKEGGGK